MLGKFFLFILAVGVMACAHPNYQDEVSAAQNENNMSSVCALKFSKLNLCAHITWEKDQTADEMGSFLIQFGKLDTENQFSAENPPVDPAVILWMPSMGHGSSPVTITEVSTGLYRISDVWFSMPGEWLIQVKLKNASSVIDEASQNIRF